MRKRCRWDFDGDGQLDSGAIAHFPCASWVIYHLNREIDEVALCIITE